MGRGDLAPGKGRGPPLDPDQACGGGQGQAARDGQGAEALELLLDEQPHAGHRDQDPAVEQDAQLGPDRDELAPRDAREEGGLLGGQQALAAQTNDGGVHLGTHNGQSLEQYGRDRM